MFRESPPPTDESKILRPTSILTPTKNSQSNLLKVEQKKKGPSKTITSPTKEKQNINETVAAQGAQSSSVSDWDMSDFNLMTYDFNNELKFMNGNLTDLNSMYKLVKILNCNCFLLQLRRAAGTSNQTQNEKYVLKVSNQLFKS